VKRNTEKGIKIVPLNYRLRSILKKKGIENWSTGIDGEVPYGKTPGGGIEDWILDGDDEVPYGT
jgi:hypothetical protein